MNRAPAILSTTGVILDGVFNVRKPAGLTSHDVVNIVRRLTGQRRVGHAGTLDPSAEGVLLVCVGKATKVVEYLVEDRKVYRAGVTLGAATDTFDATGRVLAQAEPVGVSLHSIELDLESFRGNIQQTPPRYSALKHQGQPFYKLARAGSELTPAARPVSIYRLDVVDWQYPVITLNVECSKGTYIRSLANDLGAKLGCGAFLSSLLRLRSGHFTIDTASTPDELSAAFAEGRADELIFALDHALLKLDAVIVGSARTSFVRNGVSWPASESVCQRSVGTRGPVRVYSDAGEIVAMASFEGSTGRWQPSKVF